MATREYRRTAHEILFYNIQPEILQAIRKYLEKNEITDFENNILLSVETISKKIKKKGF